MYRITECASRPCLNNGTCVDVAVNHITTFNCQCADGFTGVTCETGENYYTALEIIF